MMAVYRNTAGSVILLEDRQGRIAMQLRDDKPGLPGRNQWGLFGGLIDGGEPADLTILREVREELASTLDTSKLHLHRKHYLSEYDLTTYVFHYRVTDELDNAVLSEGQAWRWMGPDDLQTVAAVPYHRDIITDFWQGRG